MNEKTAYLCGLPLADRPFCLRWLGYCGRIM